MTTLCIPQIFAANRKRAYSPLVLLSATRKRGVIWGGDATHENPSEDFARIEAWIEEFFAEGNTDFRLQIKLYYFNTTTSKFLTDLILFCNQHYRAGRNITVVWWFFEDDIDAEEFADEFKEYECVNFQPYRVT